MHKIILFLGLFTVLNLQAQPAVNCYYYNYNIAMLAADSMNYAKFERFLDKAAQIMPHTPSSHFKIAEKYLSFHEDKKAFSHLARSLELGLFDALNDSTKKARLTPFAKSKQWAKFEKKLPEIMQKYQKNINLDYYSKIANLYANDQYVRTYVAIIDGKTMSPHILKVDSIIFASIKPMIERYGVPTYQMVGQKGMNDFFFLLIHLSLYPDYWNYLEPLFIDHFKNGAIPPNDYAIMTDRLRVWGKEKKLQLYGTFNSSKDLKQSKLSPIEDIANVDKRRFEIGLMSLAHYIDARNKQDDYSIAYPENYMPLPMEKCQCVCSE